jgi:hypothetical protein
MSEMRFGAAVCGCGRRLAVHMWAGGPRELPGRRGPVAVWAAGQRSRFTRSGLSMTYLPTLPVLLPVVAGLGRQQGKDIKMPDCGWDETLAMRSRGDRARDGWAIKTQLNQTLKWTRSAR